MFAQLFAVMAPVLAGAGVGFFWVRFKQPYPTGFITKLVLNVGTPCLIIHSLTRTHVELGAFSRMALATVSVLVVMGIIGLILARITRMDWRVIVPPTLFPNTGNMGLPVAMYAFDDKGFPLAVAVFVVMSMSQFVVGCITSSSRPLRGIFTTPTIYAIVIAVLLMAFQIKLPAWLANSVELLAGFTIPMMLITLGVALASIRARSLNIGIGFGLARVVVAGGIALLIGWLLGLTSQALGILVVMMCMPVAVYNYLFAQKAGRSPEFVANLVLCSTLTSFIYLPLLLSFVISHGQ
ncbi:AEC family transporter [Kushneria phosphatilytica]|uniref:AEC family transporter n=2 Tax=Kushneria phosphatilytica TaxID=657387 RepID=A0A5C0ZY74_9GAMM|nr:AEC family transporter [Kushneria phosphatilytica]QEL10627.1 AEC family transporter [Kushneria phosphatilytica]